MRGRLDEWLNESRYQAYAYSYPHKKAYRAFHPPRDLASVWADEPEGERFLYAHIPFCEFRCGFCNLFTEKHAHAERMDRYCEQLVAQSQTLSPLFTNVSFGSLAIGGGTPTVLGVRALDRLVRTWNDCFGVDPAAIPSSIETSPATATAERVAWIKSAGFERVSIGIQSFSAGTLKGLGRPQKPNETEGALERLGAADFDCMNIDLMYGAAGQRRSDWADTVEATIFWQPDEVFLYPVYTRERTANAKRPLPTADLRPAMYDDARARLLGSGYEQISMRLFRRQGSQQRATRYRCQEDGMLGLGCGARSYTTSLHYAERWAVSDDAVASIVDEWLARSPHDFLLAHFGYELSRSERMRRYVIQSLLHASGLDEQAFKAAFGARIRTTCPELCKELDELVRRGWVQHTQDRWSLSDEGFAYSDLIGPWLFSSEVSERSESFEVL